MNTKDWIILGLILFIVVFGFNAAWWVVIQRNYPPMATYLNTVAQQMGAQIYQELQKQQQQKAPPAEAPKR